MALRSPLASAPPMDANRRRALQPPSSNGPGGTSSRRGGSTSPTLTCGRRRVRDVMRRHLFASLRALRPARIVHASRARGDAKPGTYSRSEGAQRTLPRRGESRHQASCRETMPVRTSRAPIPTRENARPPSSRDGSSHSRKLGRARPSLEARPFPPLWRTTPSPPCRAVRRLLRFCVRVSDGFLSLHGDTLT